MIWKSKLNFTLWEHTNKNQCSIASLGNLNKTAIDVSNLLESEILDDSERKTEESRGQTMR